MFYFLSLSLVPPLIFLRLYAVLFVCPLWSCPFSIFLLWSLMGRDCLFPPSLLHREKRDGVLIGRDEAGQGRPLMLKYYLKYIEFDGTE